MKKKNTIINFGQLSKRILSVALSVVMIGNMTDLSALAVGAETTQEELSIVAFDSLSKDIREQKLDVGASEDDINFPDTLTVTVEKAKQEDAASVSDNESAAKTEKIQLADIKWELDADESDAEEFDSSEEHEGFCYVYTPVLPDADEKGNKLVLGKDVELPAIYALVGDYGVATLANDLVQVSINGESTNYTTLNDACNAISEAVNTSTDSELDITLKLLQTAKINYDDYKEFEWTLDGENKNVTLTINLNGMEMGLYRANPGTNAGGIWACGNFIMNFRNMGVVLTNSKSLTGKLYGTLNVDDQANFTLNNAYCYELDILQNGTGVLESGKCNKVVVGTLKTTSNSDARCQIKSGEYEYIYGYGGAELSIEGADTSVKNLYVYHYIKTADGNRESAKVTINLRGGIYSSVYTDVISGETCDASKGYALSNMLVPGYGFVSQDKEEPVDLTDKTEITNVKVIPVAITITEQPSIAQNKSTVLEYYAEADVPKLTIAAESTGELTYQWYQTTSDGTEDSATETAISGATESTYQIPAGLAPGTYQYYCTVSCGESSVKSDAVTFTVTQAVAKIIETKADGTTKETYYADWAYAMTYLSYSSEGEFEGVEKAEIILLQDTECSVSVVNSIGDFDGHFPKEIIIRSEGECHELSGGTVLKAVYDTTHVYMKNIKVEGSIALSGGATLTLDEKTEVVAKSKADIFEVKESKLIIGDAKVSAGIELISGSTLEVKQGAVISGPSGALDEQIKVTNTGNTAVLGAGAATPVFYGDGELSIYCKNDTADWSTSLKTTGNKKIWYPITLPEGVTLPTDGENASVVSVYNGDTYGLYQNGDTTNNSINVPGQICSYYLTKDGNNNLQKISDSKFTMPAAAVTLLGHNTDEYGVCANCGKTDLAKAYENRHLHVEGLTGRTYDSYPQILSNITLDTADGSKTLVAPSYYDKLGNPALNSPTGVGGDNPLNSDEAEYVVRYKNNAEIYILTQGEAGFDETKAPQVTIKGRGNYTGEVTIYFTIGKGTARLGDINAYTGTYNGKEQSAWELLSLQFEADPYDQYQFTEGLIDNKYISACDWAAAYKWYEDGTYKLNYKVEYSTDDQKNWITEKEFWQQH